MRSFRAILLTLFALMALCSPSFAAGLCVGVGTGPEAAATLPGQPANLPSPCELQGGKRVMPRQIEAGMIRRIALRGATDAQWARGLGDEPMRAGRVPATEPPPPRLG